MNKTTLIAIAAVVAAAEDLEADYEKPPKYDPPLPRPPKKILPARDMKIKNIKARIWNKGKGKR